MLTADDIQLILKIIGREVVIEPSDAFPYFITKAESFGYSKNPVIGPLQAKLSIMLQATTKKGNR